MKREIIYILPMGHISNRVLDEVSALVSRTFRFPVVILPSDDVPHDAYDSQRRQYKSSLILNYMEDILPDDALRCLAITDIDLYAHNLNYIFGEAVIDGRVGVISLSRLYPEIYGDLPDYELFLERAVKEAVHELGHTFGIRHCPNPRCVMHYSNNINDTDQKSVRFCDDMTRLLDTKLNTIRNSD
ncbi:MAG: archaemetzincin family Zn-dependent metalloprotease [Armatimonadota bacterium]